MASGGAGERAAAPGVLYDLLAEPAVATTLQASLAAEDAGTQTQTQVCATYFGSIGMSMSELLS